MELVSEGGGIRVGKHTRAVETGVRGFVAQSTPLLLLDLGFQGRSLKKSFKRSCLRLRKEPASYNNG